MAQRRAEVSMQQSQPPVTEPPRSGMSPALKVALFGCGGLVLLGVLAVAALVVWLASGPESGVKLANEMDEYALQYLSEHAILEPGEQLLAYYDVTISMDGSEAAIVTDRRVLYHKLGSTAALPLADVTDIRHRYESLVGDVIEIQGRGGRAMKIEIVPLNQGESFLNVLRAAWLEASGGQPAEADEEVGP